MITKEQIAELAKKYRINETVVYREYLQLLFLSRLYALPTSTKIFFKGGTALHLIYGMDRFSEDLDFTVNLPLGDFQKFIGQLFHTLSQQEEITFKERKTIAGKRYLLTARPSILRYSTFVNLDFSFREKVIQPEKSIINTAYPVLFKSYIYHLSKDEIAAEKVRAIITRNKGRDLYDLWFLINQGIKWNSRLIRQKLNYYQIKSNYRPKLKKAITAFPVKNFILDLRPFVPVNEREKLGELFRYIQRYLLAKA